MGRYDKSSNFDKDNNDRGNGHEDIFSRAVRAGKRTYFFDVKATRRGDYYLTLTESKKQYGKDGDFRFEKHKLFLYKEDFEKFEQGLSETLEYCNKHNVDFVDEEDDKSDDNVVKPDNIDNE